MESSEHSLQNESLSLPMLNKLKKDEVTLLSEKVLSTTDH